jgi:nitroreductase
MLKDLIRKNRSYRRFEQDYQIDLDTLRELVDLARLSASVSNRQALRFILSADPEVNAKIFSTLAWAGFLTDWPGPAEGERPSAYIIILHDTDLTPSIGCDHGIAAQSIMLGATEKGLGGCMIGSVQRATLHELLSIAEHYEIMLVLALGKPNEKVVIEPLASHADFEYWRDEQSVHHVPKRALEDLIVESYGE